MSEERVTRVVVENVVYTRPYQRDLPPWAYPLLLVEIVLGGSIFFAKGDWLTISIVGTAVLGFALWVISVWHDA